MIRDAYGSAGNDKKSLYSTFVLLRMKIIFRKYTCTTPLRYRAGWTLNTKPASSNFYKYKASDSSFHFTRPREILLQHSSIGSPFSIFVFMTCNHLDLHIFIIGFIKSWS